MLEHDSDERQGKKGDMIPIHPAISGGFQVENFAPNAGAGTNDRRVETGGHYSGPTPPGETRMESNL
jgi:hypothetical protein